jgi:hypothetical protein
VKASHHHCQLNSNFGMGAMKKAHHIDTITPRKSYVGVCLRSVADPDP